MLGLPVEAALRFGPIRYWHHSSQYEFAMPPPLTGRYPYPTPNHEAAEVKESNLTDAPLILLQIEFETPTIFISDERILEETWGWL
jgi:hypothetical protein